MTVGTDWRVVWLPWSDSAKLEKSIYIFVFFAHDGAQRRKDEEGGLKDAVSS